MRLPSVPPPVRGSGGNSTPTYSTPVPHPPSSSSTSHGSHQPVGRVSHHGGGGGGGGRIFPETTPARWVYWGEREREERGGERCLMCMLGVRAKEWVFVAEEALLCDG